MTKEALLMEETKDNILQTPLWGLHKNLDARMVEFAGYDMPVQYKNGVKNEHIQVRNKAGLFDVSHMGQVLITSINGGDPAIALEKLVPSDIKGLALGKMRYTVLLNEDGGILDDLIVTRLDERTLYAVLNASRKYADIDYIKAKIGDEIKITLQDDLALIALQGPLAEKVIMDTIMPEVAELGFMNAKYTDYRGADILVSRSGYTGEDGFEISVPNELAEDLAKELLADNDKVWAIGLGARDSLRLEAGFCLYGHDITENTTPVEGGISWTIPKHRRENASFMGANKILRQMKEGVAQKRVGLMPDGKAPIREGVEIFDNTGENKIGVITSGGYSPVLEAPIAMGYIAIDEAKIGTTVVAKMRGKNFSCKIVKMPFVSKEK